ncbi:MAG: cytochrome b N-terminal domain-containing protein [Planctomycetes bacterium]|nr:cytochrome b N-terminal domain-containing protein [Planctomycetota bacterium]
MTTPDDRPGDQLDAVRPGNRGLWEVLLTATLSGVHPDESTSFKSALRSALARPVSRRRATALRFSAVLQTLLVLLVVTGVIAAVFYRPSVDGALASVHDLESGSAGWLVRQLHVWSGRSVLVLAIIMLARGVFVATYKRRGRWKWVAGCSLLPVLWAFLATGALLPFDAHAIGATSTLASTLGKTPLVGPLLETFLAGASPDSADVHARMWIAHSVLLPWLLFFLLLVIFSVVSRRHDDPATESKPLEGAPLWPHRTLDVAIAITFALGAVFVLALVWPVDLGGPATTTAATAAVDPVFRPFTGVYALFSGWGDAWGGITALSLVFAVLTGLFLLPWIDRSSEVAAGRRKVFVVPSLVVLLLLLLLIFVGEGLP